MSNSSVVLFHATAPGLFWTVDASSANDGKISICSGDSNAEWYIHIPARAKPHLQVVLAKKCNRAISGEDIDQDILSMLQKTFGGRDKNPFEEIKEFLNASNVSWKEDFWGYL